MPSCALSTRYVSVDSPNDRVVAYLLFQPSMLQIGPNSHIARRSSSSHCPQQNLLLCLMVRPHLATPDPILLAGQAHAHGGPAAVPLQHRTSVEPQHNLSPHFLRSRRKSRAQDRHVLRRARPRKRFPSTSLTGHRLQTALHLAIGSLASKWQVLRTSLYCQIMQYCACGRT